MKPLPTYKLIRGEWHEVRMMELCKGDIWKTGRCQPQLATSDPWIDEQGQVRIRARPLSLLPEHRNPAKRRQEAS